MARCAKNTILIDTTVIQHKNDHHGCSGKQWPTICLIYIRPVKWSIILIELSNLLNQRPYFFVNEVPIGSPADRHTNS